MQTISDSLLANGTDLPCSIIGVNRKDAASANQLATAGRNLPWIQDTDEADVWGGWSINYRDVVVVDGLGTIRGIINLTSFDLGNANNANQLTNNLLSLSKLPDLDGDQLSDAWEIAGGFSVASVRPHFDGSGMVTISMRSDEPIADGEGYFRLMSRLPDS